MGLRRQKAQCAPVLLIYPANDCHGIIAIMQARLRRSSMYLNSIRNSICFFLEGKYYTIVKNNITVQMLVATKKYKGRKMKLFLIRTLGFS